MDAEQQVADRDEQPEQLRDIDRGPVEEGVHQRQAVDEGEARAARERAAAPARDLHEAQAPAAALRDVFLEAFGGEPERERLVQIGGGEARFLQPQRQQIVFRDGIGRKAADPHQRLEADDGRGAAAERRAPGILRGQHDIEEEALLVRPDMGGGEIGLDRVGIDEMLRRLHQADVRIPEQAQRSREEIRERDEIRVQDRDERRRIRQGRQMRQSMIDVAGLGMAVVRPGQIAAAQALRQFLEPGAAAVVEHPDAIIAVVHPGRADDGALEDGLFLVVGADQDIDQRRLQACEPGLVRLDLGRTVPRPAQEDRGQDRRRKRRRFRDQENAASREIGRPADRRQGRRHAPVEITQQQQQPDANHQHARGCPVMPQQRGEHDGKPGRSEARRQCGQEIVRHGAEACSPNTTRPVRPTAQTCPVPRSGTETVTR